MGHFQLCILNTINTFMLLAKSHMRAMSKINKQIIAEVTVVGVAQRIRVEMFILGVF